MKKTTWKWKMKDREEFLGSSTGNDNFHLYLAHSWHSNRMFWQDVFSCTKSIVKSPWIQIHLESNPTDILTLITYRPFNALKSLIPSAGPQIWITSSLVSFNKSAPVINISKWVIRQRFSLSMTFKMDSYKDTSLPVSYSHNLLHGI